MLLIDSLAMSTLKRLVYLTILEKDLNPRKWVKCKLNNLTIIEKIKDQFVMHSTINLDFLLNRWNYVLYTRTWIRWRTHFRGSKSTRDLVKSQQILKETLFAGSWSVASYILSHILHSTLHFIWNFYQIVFLVIVYEIMCLLGLARANHVSVLMIHFIFYPCFIGGVTFVSLERSMTRRGQRVKKRREKLLILCSTMLVSCFAVSHLFCVSFFFGLLSYLGYDDGKSPRVVWSCEKNFNRDFSKNKIKGP